MARGDITMFQEAKAFLLDGGFASTDDIKVALITNAVAPTAADVTPALTDYTEVTPGGNYAAGGISIGTIAAIVTQTGGVVTVDSATNPSWLTNAANPTDAAYAIIYNDTTGDQAIAFIDLAGPINMTVDDLTITWNVSGIFTIT